jgi:ribosome maturation factor RimP
MPPGDALERIREIASRVAAGEGLELVDVELHGSGPGAVVRVYLDRPGGITHGDCQNVSRQLGAILDVEDVMHARYTLEVSSPGLDRRLAKQTDYERFAGHQVSMTLRAPQAGRRRFKGKLLGFREGKVALETETGEVFAFDREQIERANLVPEFSTKAPLGSGGSHSR